MRSTKLARPGEYVLANGAQAVGRLNVLHKIYSPTGRQALGDSGISEGMIVADFGCGSGAMSRLLASLVGP